MFSLEQLRTFDLCATLGSFSATARKLGKAQSSISQTIATLELDLGVTLFDRTPKHPVLTHQGKQLWSYAKAVLAQAQTLDVAARCFAEDHEDTLTLIVDAALQTPAFLRLIQRFHGQFPQINLTLMTEASQYIPEQIRLNQGQFGLMLIHGPIPTGVDCGFIGSMSFCVVAGHQHPLSKQTAVSYSDLLQHQQLRHIESLTDDRTSLPDLSPKQSRSNDYEALKGMLLSNTGWAYMPVHTVENALKQGTLQRLPVTFDVKTWSVPVERVIPAGAQKTAALQWWEQQSASLFSDLP